jgi:hypothetical protein
VQAAAGLKAALAARLEEAKERVLAEGVDIVDSNTPFVTAASGRAAAPVAAASARASAPVAGGARQSLVKLEPGLGVGLGDGTGEGGSNPAVRLRGWSRPSIVEAVTALSRQRSSLVGQDEARRKRQHRLYSIGDLQVRHSLYTIHHTHHTLYSTPYTPGAPFAR